MSVNASAQTGIPESELDDLVGRAMVAFQVPGIAVGIVKDGEVLHAKGYGIRELGKPGRVDAETMFGIASNTKAFTAGALLILADEGKLSLDGAVIDYLPHFRLSDPYMTREFTVRDLLTHRGGYGAGAGDLLIVPETDFTPAEVVARLRHLELEYGFRSGYAYNNLLYIVAGEVVRSVAKTGFEDFIESRILAPLEMDGCVAQRDRLSKDSNISGSHGFENGELAAVRPLYDTAVVAAAGGIWCNIEGMNKWLLLQLNRGRMRNGERLLSKQSHYDSWAPQTIIPLPMVTPVWEQDPERHRRHFQAYGLGWRLEDYFGLKRILHGGGMNGMRTQVSMLPELGLGIVVLTNQGTMYPIDAIIDEVLTAFIPSAEERDWVSGYRRAKERFDAEQALQEAAVEERLKVSRSPAPLPLDAYEGTYRDPWRGEVTIRSEQENLVLRFSRTSMLEGPLEHYKGGIFIVRWRERSLSYGGATSTDAFVRFSFNFDGEVQGMTMKPVSPGIDFSYDFQNLLFHRIEE